MMYQYNTYVINFSYSLSLTQRTTVLLPTQLLLNTDCSAQLVIVLLTLAVYIYGSALSSPI